MTYLIGLALAFGSIVASIGALHQNVMYYYDQVALYVVSGGTLAVALMIFPWDAGREVILRSLATLYRPHRLDLRQVAADCLAFVRRAETGEFPKAPGPMASLSERILAEGGELMALGFAVDRIEPILAARIQERIESINRMATAFRSLAKYPPAFGLTGTVLGLASIMRAISDGAGADETGMRMAVALVSTLYGLLVANLIVNPAGETVAKFALAEAKSAEMALQAVMLAGERVSILEAQEMLNSYLPRSQRLELPSSSEAGGNAA